MTICIVSLANDKKKAVLVADRLLTTHGLLPNQADSGEGKIFDINENVKAMFCGGYADAVTVIDIARRTLDNKKWVTEVAEHLNDKHLEYLNGILIRTHLTSRGIKSLEDFYRSQDLNLDPKVRQEIDRALTTYNLTGDLRFIVCGKDSDGLFKVYTLNSNPRNIIQLQTAGYATIGSGEHHANFALIHSGHNISLSDVDIKSILLDAKKKAEKTPDVGPETDVVIME